MSRFKAGISLVSRPAKLLESFDLVNLRFPSFVIKDGEITSTFSGVMKTLSKYSSQKACSPNCWQIDRSIAVTNTRG